MDESSISLVIAGVLSFLLAVITGSLSAVSAVRWSSLEKMSEDDKKSGAGKVLKLLKSSEDKVLSGLGGLYLVLAIAIGSLLFYWAHSLPGATLKNSILFVCAGIVVILVLAESFPRYLARINPEKSCIFLFPIISAITTITVPISNLSAWIFSPVISRLDKGANGNIKITEEEIMRIVDEGEELGVLETEERKMIHSVIEFTDTIVREVMVPRVDMHALDDRSTLADASELMMESGFSRIPIFKESLDNIIGMLYTKDFLPQILEGSLDTPAIEVARKPPFFVPEKKPVAELLREMQKKSISIAIVVDEYGGTDGLVTIEDILEEIVGEITDEYDRETPPIIKVEEDLWSVDGGLIIEDLNEELDIDVPAEEHETVGGFVYGELGHIPDKGETLNLEEIGIDIVVDVIENQRLQRLSVRKHPSKPEDEEDED